MASQTDTAPDADRADRKLGRVLAVFGVIAVVVVAAGIALPILATHHNAPDGLTADSAEATVREFVTSSVVAQDGQAACGYLTTSEQTALARLANTGGACRQALDRAASFHGVEGAGDVRGLDLQATVTGRTARVTAPGSPRAVFTLTPAPPGAAPSYGVPQEPWRIASGAEQVLASQG
jgi:hypothetical protein